MTAELRSEDERLNTRMFNFSDAIFAFALTLLALDLRPPSGDLEDWRAETPVRLFLFALTFSLVSVFWAGHMTMTRRLERFDWPILWLNLAFLAVIALTPFATSLLNSNLPAAESWRLYCWTMVAASAVQTSLSVAVTRDAGRLIGGIKLRERISRILRAASPGIAFATGLVALNAGENDLARWCWLLVFPILVIARVIAPRRASNRPRPARRG